MKNLNNLSLNVLTFAWPEQMPAFYFTEVETEKCRKLHYSLYPDNIEKLFPGITADKERSLYTTFDYKTMEGKVLNIDFRNDNPNLIRRYYNNRINYYFRLLQKCLVKTDFVNNNQVWLPQPELSTETWDVFEKYTLKLQFCQVSDYPELVVSYDGRSKLLKQSVAALVEEVDTGILKWIYHDRALHRYDKLVEIGFTDFHEAQPVLNNPISQALRFTVEIPPPSNGYKTYLNKISRFINTYLDTPEFRRQIPLHSAKLLPVRPIHISRTADESNLLAFAGGNKERVPYFGMSNYGPFRPPSWKNMRLFYIFHEDDKQQALDFHKLFTTSSGNYKGFQQFAKVLLHTQKNFSISFNNRENPVPEVSEALRKRDFDPDIRYIAIYLSPWGKYEKDAIRRKAYYHIKELLLKHNITMQGVETAKIKNRDGNFQYSLTNISLAMLAKLGGVPWRLDTPVKNELIIGVGAFRHFDTRLQYIGSAFSFDNKGGFNGFECFLKHETRLLAGSISAAVREFVTRNQQIERLIIHFYKTMSRVELQPIEEALENLGLDIPVFIVSINKTESRGMVGFDMDWADLMPLSGTHINIGKNRYLLFNNTRYNGSDYKRGDGYPFPVKLSINCTYPELLDENMVTGGLIEQVYQFSRLYYKSVRQQGLPITIKYPEILAQLAPNFRDNAIPGFGKDNLWFL